MKVNPWGIFIIVCFLLFSCKGIVFSHAEQQLIHFSFKSATVSTPCESGFRLDSKGLLYISNQKGLLTNRYTLTRIEENGNRKEKEFIVPFNVNLSFQIQGDFVLIRKSTTAYPLSGYVINREYLLYEIDNWNKLVWSEQDQIYNFRLFKDAVIKYKQYDSQISLLSLHSFEWQYINTEAPLHRGMNGSQFLCISSRLGIYYHVASKQFFSLPLDINSNAVCVDDGHTIVAECNGAIYCSSLDTNSFQLVYSTNVFGAISHSFCIDQNTLYIFNQINNELIAIDLADYSIITIYPIDLANRDWIVLDSCCFYFDGAQIQRIVIPNS